MAPFFPIIRDLTPSPSPARRGERPGGNNHLSVNTLTLELDPEDPGAEDRGRQKAEDAAQRLLQPALRSAQEELNGLLREGRLTLIDLQALNERYHNNFSEVLAEAMRRVARQERSDALQQAWKYAVSRTVEDGAAAGLRVAFGQLGNVGVNLNYDLLNRFARDWAQVYSYNLITRIDESTGRQVGDAVVAWMESGAHLDALVAHLEPTFGVVRAEAIAATETTRAFAEGTLLGYRQSGLVLATMWKTAVDERVCPICRPLHGAIGDLNGNFRHPGGVGKAFRYEGRMFRPPGHVRCRCAIAPIVDEARLKGK